MDNVVFERLEKMETKIDAIYVSVEKTRKYFQWTMIISLIVVILPAIGLAFVIPMLMGSYAESILSMQF